MSKKLLAILGHYISTIEKLHMITTRKVLHVNVVHQEQLAEVVTKVLKPVFNEPANTSFQEKCKNKVNQDSHESFNSIHWLVCPKEQFNVL